MKLIKLGLLFLLVLLLSGCSVQKTKTEELYAGLDAQATYEAELILSKVKGMPLLTFPFC